MRVLAFQSLMDILLLGGTGLISTSIARQLLERGDNVTLFNRGQSENRLPDDAQEIRGDRREYSQFESTFADARYDVVCDMISFSPDDAASALRASARPLSSPSRPTSAVVPASTCS